MSAFSGNGIYFAIDGTDMSAYFTTINFEPSVEEQDITRGSGTGRPLRPHTTHMGVVMPQS